MNIQFSDLPTAATMKNLCQNIEDRYLSLQALILFATITAALAIIFIMPLVIAVPVGLLCGQTFCSDYLLTIGAWIQSAEQCAVSTSAIFVVAALIVRNYMRRQFGAPTYHGELQVELSHEETRKLCRAYLRAEAVDEIFMIDRSERRQIALVQEGKFFNTFLEVSTTALDDNRTWIVFRGASKVNAAAVLINVLFTDFGSSRENALRMIDIFRPYASRKQFATAKCGSAKQADVSVRMIHHAPPPAIRQSIYS